MSKREICFSVFVFLSILVCFATDFRLGEMFGVWVVYANNQTFNAFLILFEIGALFSFSIFFYFQFFAERGKKVELQDSTGDEVNYGAIRPSSALSVDELADFRLQASLLEKPSVMKSAEWKNELSGVLGRAEAKGEVPLKEERVGNDTKKGSFFMMDLEDPFLAGEGGEVRPVRNGLMKNLDDLLDEQHDLLSSANALQEEEADYGVFERKSPLKLVHFSEPREGAKKELSDFEKAVEKREDTVFYGRLTDLVNT